MFGMRDVMLKFVGMGISTEESIRIYKRFGSGSVEKITQKIPIGCVLTKSDFHLNAPTRSQGDSVLKTTMNSGWKAESNTF